MVAVALLAIARTASGAPIDPTVPGPYAVGETTRTFTKASVTTGDPRVLATRIWYPALPDGGIVPRRWPLLLFSHGSCSVPEQSTFLMDALASWGMVVAAPPHPGNTALDGAATCNANLQDSFLNRVADVVFVLDQLQLENATPGAFFSHRLNVKRAGVMGHSFGGQTAIRALAADRRFRAALAISPRPAIDLVVTQPLLVMTGALDSVTPFETDARMAFAVARGPRYLVRLPDTGHCACIPLCLPAVCGDGCPPVGIAPTVANARVQRMIVPFAMAYVAGKGPFKRLLDPATIPVGIDVIDWSTHRR
jgi:predicted dienelactone hydrolase